MCKRFYFEGSTFDPATGRLCLNYKTDDLGNFCEEVVFPNAPFQITPEKKAVLEHIFFYALLAAGISYFKMTPLYRLTLSNGSLTRQEADFFNTFYINGLGEFAIKNKLNLQQSIHFPHTCQEKKFPVYHMPTTNRVFVPIGGGKDSCVTTELIKRMPFEPSLISVGNPPAIQHCATATDLEHHVIKRTLDPYLKILNESGKVLNGHIPITGVLAFYLWIYAVLTDTPFIAMSCENSSNEGNLYQGALAINHQYSKSFAFEKDFESLTRPLTPDFDYFSLLRPLTEAHIAKLFSKYGTPYFSVFTSCNKAFRLDEKKRLTHWCGQCDKCRFVFLILAPFMDRETLIQSVGSNPLNDLTQETGYRELLGLTGHKPFECVGTIDECRYALNMIAQKKQWQKDVLVRLLHTEITQEFIPEESTLFSALGSHKIPPAFYNVFSFFHEV